MHMYGDKQKKLSFVVFPFGSSQESGIDSNPTLLRAMEGVTLGGCPPFHHAQ